MWVRVHEILPDKCQYYKVILRDRSHTEAYYTGHDFIDKYAKKIVLVDEWYKEV